MRDDDSSDAGGFEMLGTHGRRWTVHWGAGGRLELQRWFSDLPERVRCTGLRWKVAVSDRTIAVKVPQRCMRLGHKARFSFGVTNEAPTQFLNEFVPSSVFPDTDNPVSEYARFIRRG